MAPKGQVRRIRMNRKDPTPNLRDKKKKILKDSIKLS
jgi:hypothetical protein